jgi:hypothetical protein
MGMTSSPTLYRRERDWSLSHRRLDQIRGRRYEIVHLFQTLPQGIGRIDSRSPHGLPSIDFDLARFDHRRPALHLGVHVRFELRR